MTHNEMMQMMFALMCPNNDAFPGANLSNGEEIILALCVLLYMSDDEDDTLSYTTLYDILQGKWADMDEMKVGKAFGAALQINQGNKYATNVIATVLKGYNGSEVPQGIAALLHILEGYLVMQGTEGETAH